MKAICIIPARLQSTRLPEKLLMRLGEKSIIEHVHENCRNANTFSDILIAVDDERLFDHCRTFSDSVIMTSNEHQSGTDRIHEAYLQSGLQADFIVNVQADEPFLTSQHIVNIVEAHKTSDCDVMTAMTHIQDFEELYASSCVKVVTGADGNALYFSRAAIPFMRDFPMEEWLDHHKYMKHIGVYSYTQKSLNAFVQIPPGRLEQIEKLEQLRLLEKGYSYSCIELEYDGFGIDTMEDYQKAIQRFNS